jgi:hypothetical protein
MPTRVLRFSVLAFLVLPFEARAQSSTHEHLSEVLPNLILQGITLPRPAVDGVSHHVHFSPIASNDLDNPAVGIVRSFNKLMMVQLSSFPLGSSAGGFTYTFDESLGTFRRASGSFGPSFAERAVPIGRGKLSAGITYQHTRYEAFEGRPLDGGAIRFYLLHEDCCTASGGGGGMGSGGGGGSGPVEQPNGTRLNPAFEGDLIEAALSLKASTDTVAFMGNYGVTNRWDIGVVVPIVRVELDASVDAAILRLATEQNPLLHTFEAGNAQASRKTFRQSGGATGIGDVLLRTKYQMAKFAGGGLSGAVDLRLPTGDKRDLLGTGTQVKTFLIASGGTDRFIEHVNIGYTFSTENIARSGLLSMLGSDEPVPNELNYAAGLEFVAGPRLTLVGDVVGRMLRGAGRLEVSSKSFAFQGATAVQTAQFDEFDPRSGHLNVVLGAAGFKFNPTGNWLVSANVLFPLTDVGLRSRVTTVVGLDYAF